MRLSLGWGMAVPERPCVTALSLSTGRMPEPDTRYDVGRWASASLRTPPTMATQPPARPERRRRGVFSKVCACCRCCAGRNDDADWGPAPGEVPGERRAEPVVRGEHYWGELTDPVPLHLEGTAGGSSQPLPPPTLRVLLLGEACTTCPPSRALLREAGSPAHTPLLP